jgi:hypothetical protein
MGGHIVVGCEAGFKPRLLRSHGMEIFEAKRTDLQIRCQTLSPCHHRRPFDRLRNGLPDSVTVAQQILVLFVQVRILVG